MRQFSLNLSSPHLLLQHAFTYLLSISERLLLSSEEKKNKSTRKSYQETRSSFQQERGKEWRLILLASAWKCTSFCFLYETNKKPSDYLSLVIFLSLDFGHLLYHSEGPITEWKLHRRDLFTFLPQLSPFLKCWPFKTLSRTLPRASTEKWKFPLIAN